MIHQERDPENQFREPQDPKEKDFEGPFSSRREFLKNIGVAAAALAVNRLSPEERKETILSGTPTQVSNRLLGGFCYREGRMKTFSEMIEWVYGLESEERMTPLFLGANDLTASDRPGRGRYIMPADPDLVLSRIEGKDFSFYIVANVCDAKGICQPCPDYGGWTEARLPRSIFVHTGEWARSLKKGDEVSLYANIKGKPSEEVLRLTLMENRRVFSRESAQHLAAESYPYKHGYCSVITCWPPQTRELNPAQRAIFTFRATKVV